MPAQLEICLGTNQDLKHLLIASCHQPVAELKPPGQVSRLQLVAADGLVGMILELLRDPVVGGFDQSQDIPPGHTDMGHSGISKPLVFVPIQHSFDSFNVLWSIDGVSPFGMRVTRA